MKEKSQNQKTENDCSAVFQCTKMLSSSDGMNTETINNLFILTRKIVVVTTISSVNPEEVNPSSSVISPAKISGMDNESESSIRMEI